jgi:hypothetical protein
MRGSKFWYSQWESDFQRGVVRWFVFDEFNKIDDENQWTLDLITDTPTYRLSGGLTIMNCSLARILEEYLLKNFHNYSMLILFSGSGSNKFKTMLLKI